MSDEQSADYCRTLVTACVMVELTALTREQHWLNLAERMVRDVEKSLRFWPTTRERVVDTDMPRALAHRNVIEWREQVRVAQLAWGQRTLVVHLTAEKPTAKPPVKGVKHHVIEEPEQQHSPGATALAALKAEGIAEVATGVWSGHRA
jgi:hypothetical protein